MVGLVIEMAKDSLIINNKGIPKEQTSGNYTSHKDKQRNT